MVSSAPRTSVAPGGTSHMISHPNSIRLAWRADPVPRFNTRWSLMKRHSVAKPITRKAADTGRAPGVRIAPKSKRGACSQTRSENSGAKGAHTIMSVSGRGVRGCPPSIACTLREFIYRKGQPTLLPTQKWPKSRENVY
jgi:hypothetical protein